MKNLLYFSAMGAIVAPPLPSFYRRPQSVAELVDHTARRAIGHLGIDGIAPAIEWHGG